jgi:biotin transporter BioY
MRSPPAWLPLAGPVLAGGTAGLIGARADVSFGLLLALAIGAGVIPLLVHRFWSRAARTTAHTKEH